ACNQCKQMVDNLVRVTGRICGKRVLGNYVAVFGSDRNGDLRTADVNACYIFFGHVLECFSISTLLSIVSEQNGGSIIDVGLLVTAELVRSLCEIQRTMK